MISYKLMAVAKVYRFLRMLVIKRRCDCAKESLKKLLKEKAVMSKRLTGGHIYMDDECLLKKAMIADIF